MSDKYRNTEKNDKTLCPRKLSRAREVATFGSHPCKSLENLARHAEVSEKAIERYLVERARLAGMLCLKYSNPNMTGYPDRLLVTPGGGVVWVELKSRGRRPAKIQLARMAQLMRMGHKVAVIDNRPDVDELIKSIKQ